VLATRTCAEPTTLQPDGSFPDGTDGGRLPRWALNGLAYLALFVAIIAVALAGDALGLFP